MSAEIKKIFDAQNVPISPDDVWKVQAAWVVKHKALERLAAAMGIVFSAPNVLRAERDEAVILVAGNYRDKSEWSIGEALVNTNYRVSGKQAAYVYAMAEKRAKDRVILKLANLHGVYSEDEADDFKQPARSAALEMALEAATRCKTKTDLRSCLSTNKAALDEREAREFTAACKEIAAALPEAEQKEAA
jgi:hypothetical protein